MPRPSDPHAKSRLLEAAERVFSEKGLDRAKVEDITTQAGLSKGAFYLHFDSKGDAFKELLSEVISHLQTRMDAATSVCLPTLGPTLEQSLEESLARDVEMFEFIWKNRALMRITLEGGRSADYQHLIEHFASSAQRDTEALLRRGIASGVYRSDLDVEAAAAFIAGGYDRFARQLVRETKKPDLRKRLHQLRWMVFAGAGTPALVAELQQLHSESGAAPSSSVKSIAT
ncbi:MAG TPA: TetR/AcrR family transcriptional regulator [Polyangiaceae bacterium]|jgi:AcrR family transcriptional regulator|nr:TetR/AcrR family transcriptional regulator [Polyangiaceae bacterium]